MKLSGWCSPWCSTKTHHTCQDRLERGLLDRCDCPKGHLIEPTHTTAATLHDTEESADA